MIIKNLRIQNGLSQEKLANITNLSTRTIQRIEKDDIGSIESLNKIAIAFNIDVKKLKNMIHDKETVPNIKTNKKDKKLILFILVNTMLFIINILTTPGYLWFIYPLLGWGIPLFYKKYKKSF